MVQAEKISEKSGGHIHISIQMTALTTKDTSAPRNRQSRAVRHIKCMEDLELSNVVAWVKVGATGGAAETWSNASQAGAAKGLLSSLTNRVKCVKVTATIIN